MFGIAVEPLASMFGDNQSIVSNSSKHRSDLKKKCPSIAYHFCHEGFVKNEWQNSFLNTHLSPLDMFTKYFPSSEKRNLLTVYLLQCLEYFSFLFVMEQTS